MPETGHKVLAFAAGAMVTVAVIRAGRRWRLHRQISRKIKLKQDHCQKALATVELALAEANVGWIGEPGCQVHIHGFIQFMYQYL